MIESYLFPNYYFKFLLFELWWTCIKYIPRGLPDKSNCEWKPVSVYNFLPLELKISIELISSVMLINNNSNLPFDGFRIQSIITMHSYIKNIIKICATYYYYHNTNTTIIGITVLYHCFCWKLQDSFAGYLYFKNLVKSVLILSNIQVVFSPYIIIVTSRNLF